MLKVLGLRLFSQIKIRVRSPCGEFKDSKCSENVDLYPKIPMLSDINKSPFRKIDKDKVLIQWLILGGDGMVVARDEAPPDKNYWRKIRPKPTQKMA